MKSSERYLHSLIVQGENQQLDFKFEIKDARKIARTLSAFANTEGGRLLIGVKDNGRISGIRSDEEFYMVESAASLYCKPEVNFDSHLHVVEGRNVLEIYIPPAKTRPVYAKDEKGKWLAYIRVADENILAHLIQLNLWKEEHQVRGKLLEFTRREQFLLDSLEAMPGASLSRIQRDTGYSRKELLSILTRLVRFDVVDMRYGEGQFIFRLREKPGE